MKSTGFRVTRRGFPPHSHTFPIPRSQQTPIILSFYILSSPAAVVVVSGAKAENFAAKKLSFLFHAHPKLILVGFHGGYNESEGILKKV